EIVNNSAATENVSSTDIVRFWMRIAEQCQPCVGPLLTDRSDRGNRRDHISQLTSAENQELIRVAQDFRVASATIIAPQRPNTADASQSGVIRSNISFKRVRGIGKSSPLSPTML